MNSLPSQDATRLNRISVSRVTSISAGQASNLCIPCPWKLVVQDLTATGTDDIARFGKSLSITYCI